MSQPNRLEIGPPEGFDVVIRGYDRVQVEGHLRSLGREFSVLRADLDASQSRVEKLAKNLAAARAEAENLKAKAEAAGDPSFGNMSAQISNMLKSAEVEAADIRRVAQEEQSRTRTDVESVAEQCASMRTEAQNEARRLVEDAHREAQRALELAQNGAAKLVAEANTQVERARAESEVMVAGAQRQVAELEAQAVEIRLALNQRRQALETRPAFEASVSISELSAGSAPGSPAVYDPSGEAPHRPPSAEEVSEPGGSEAGRAVQADHPSPESEETKPDQRVLAREDVLEYRHTRRRMR